MWWYGHVLRKDDDWVQKCVEYEAEGPRPRGRPKRTWREVVEKDCQAHKLNNRMLWIVVDGGSWYRMSDEQDGCEWVTSGGLLIGIPSPTHSFTLGLNPCLNPSFSANPPYRTLSFFSFRFHYMDFPDCLLLLLSISVFLLFSFFSVFTFF